MTLRCALTFSRDVQSIVTLRFTVHQFTSNFDQCRLTEDLDGTVIDLQRLIERELILTRLARRNIPNLSEKTLDRRAPPCFYALHSAAMAPSVPWSGRRGKPSAPAHHAVFPFDLQRRYAQRSGS